MVSQGTPRLQALSSGRLALIPLTIIPTVFYLSVGLGVGHTCHHYTDTLTVTITTSLNTFIMIYSY